MSRPKKCAELETIWRVVDTNRGKACKQRPSAVSSETFQIYEGTSQIQRMIIGREVFKEIL